VISLFDSGPRERLRTYLNDHLAGATAGLALCKRIRDRNRGTPLGDAFVDLLDQLEQDERELRRLVDRLDLPVNVPKKLVATAVERLGRLKLNGQLLGYSPLSRFEELELLSIGIMGKAKLWSALKAVDAGWAPVAGMDLDELYRRAMTQHDRVEHFRIEAAREAIKAGTGS
jgi:hypothetical protein